MPPDTPAGSPAAYLVAQDRKWAVIPRVTKGSSARGALGYDFGPGRREEHENPRTVAGNVPGTWRDQSDLIDAHTAQRPDLSRPIWRTSLRAAPQDRTLSDEEWGRAAERYATRMGFADAPWTATRHGADHIHFTASRLDWNGRVVSDSHDYARAQAACRVIEREHHLVDASARYDRARPQVSHGEKERAERLGVPAERERLRERLEVATDRAGGSLAGYEKALGEAGVVYRRNQATTGRVSGYSYGLDGHTDAEGRQVFYKGSQLGKDYRWGHVQQRLDQQAPRQDPRRYAGSEESSEENPARARARAALDRIRGGGSRLPIDEQDRQALAARSPSQENAPRPDAMKGNDMDQTRPGGQTDPATQPRNDRDEDAQVQPQGAAREAMQRIRDSETTRQQERDRDSGVER